MKARDERYVVRPIPNIFHIYKGWMPYWWRENIVEKVRKDNIACFGESSLKQSYFAAESDNELAMTVWGSSIAIEKWMIYHT